MLTGNRKELRLSEFEEGKVEAEFIIEKKRRDRLMTDLKAKVKLLSSTLNDMGESVSSLVSDLDIWAQGHVNMITR